MALLPALLGGPASPATSVTDLIKRSMKMLGVLAAGESPRAEDVADCFVELSALLGTWANQRLLIHGVRRDTYTLVPSLSPHTIGVGGTFDTSRPLRFDAANVIQYGSTNETPVRLLTDGEYQAISDKSFGAPIPTSLWVEQTYPLANLWFWPVPTLSPTLVLYSWSKISDFASTDTVSLPDGYENALAMALAIQIAPMYGVEPSPTLQQNAMESLAAIKRTNTTVAFLKSDPALLNRSGASTMLGGGGGTDSGGLY